MGSDHSLTMPSKKKRPAPLDLSIVDEKQDDFKRVVTVSTKAPNQDDQPKTKKKKRGPYDPEELTKHKEDDGLQRMVRLSTIFQSEGFQKDDQLQTKKKKRGPYDPEVYRTIEQIRQEAEKATQVEEAQEQDLIQQAMEVEKTVDPNEPPPMVCPFHIEMLVNMPNNKGYSLMKCPEQPCFISILDENNKEAYMKGAYEGVHKDIQDVGHRLLCDCGYLPSLRQSRTQKNPDRMYLCCRNKDGCKYFKWADEPLADPEDVMTCPRHLEKMEERTSQNGWQYLRCPSIPCMLFCGKEQGPKYMAAVRQGIHPDICDRWEKLNCFCGHYPVLKQSKSYKNPDSLYLSCGDNQKCKFF